MEYLDTLGRKAVESQVGKRDSYVIVAQLSPVTTRSRVAGRVVGGRVRPVGQVGFPQSWGKVGRTKVGSACMLSPELDRVDNADLRHGCMIR
ncbi:hypothetical protein DU505_06035 [Billgrantia montanilacus]|uniref:Uncharacterized protein n=1 Tax=Billgrantia montanilacus TaxID=2282305 RepID=A0A368U622_9GAMM|nr:hypothetical protein DU505_06035 [Halomonas montanilacus]